MTRLMVEECGDGVDRLCVECSVGLMEQVRESSKPLPSFHTSTHTLSVIPWMSKERGSVSAQGTSRWTEICISDSPDAFLARSCVACMRCVPLFRQEKQCRQPVGQFSLQVYSAFLQSHRPESRSLTATLRVCRVCQFAVHMAK